MSTSSDQPTAGSLTDQQKKVVAFALVVHLIVATLTWRDLRRRPDAAVRGRKRMWRLAATMNTSGSLAYWLFGRRRLPDAAEASAPGPGPGSAPG